MKTRKLLLALIAAACSLPSFAEGYQVNTLSARQVALGHTGVSQKLNAESMYFNPAGIGYMNSTFDFSAGFTGIIPTATCTYNNVKYTTDNKVSTPIFAYAAFKVSNPVKIGLAFYTPYGSSINWSENWPGAIGSQKVSLSTFCLQPTVAWRILPNLSVGAGITVAWGKVDLYKGLVLGSSLDQMMVAMGGTAMFADITPASVNLKGTSKLAVGFNVGAMYDINSKFTVGASFRSKMMAKVGSGDASVTFANSVAKQLLESSVGLIDKANFKAEMPMPYSLTFGLSYRPVSKLELSFDAQLTGWSAYKQLDVEFHEASLQSFNQYLPKNYKNSWAFRLGAAYNLTKRLELLAGFNVDTTPVNVDYYNPETPGMTKVSPSLGLVFRPIEQISVSFGCSYIAGLGMKDAKYAYDDIIAS
ncbi:MAG: outer membrane protein transport protein, partial [Muribaculaceae bacterium]|nr:outer membrane protein transport protein [Muribaculaceae bacterium]